MLPLEKMKNITPTFHRVIVQKDVNICYRSAGNPSNPVILLLHGFPTSSNMFRNLIPLLATKFYVIAPDLPGYGFTEVPRDYDFSFAKLTEAVEQLLEHLSISKYSLYVFDYGAPVGFRLALRQPSNIAGLVIQNGNAYEVGLDDGFWGSIKEYWKHDQTNETYIKAFTEYLQDKRNVISQYVGGVQNPDSVDPANYTLDISLLSRPSQAETQIKLFYDYKKNVDLYPEFQKFLRSTDIPILVTWGKNDKVFNVEGAESYRKDIKSLKIVYYDSGHFALETHVADIAYEITNYFYDKIAS